MSKHLSSNLWPREISVLIIILFISGCFIFRKTPSTEEDLSQNPVFTMILESHQDQAEGLIKQLPDSTKKDLVNGLAWFGESPGDINFQTGFRGQLAHLSGRFLAFPLSQFSNVNSLREKANYFFSKKGEGRTLLQLTGTDELRFRKESRRVKGKSFSYHQYWKDIPVYQASVQITLNEQGEMTELNSTAYPNVSPEKGQKISQQQSREILFNHLRQSGDSIWLTEEPNIISSQQTVVNLTLLGGPDKDRLAFHYIVSPPGNIIGGDREVLIDQLNGNILLSQDLTRYLTDQDQVRLGTGRIGGRAGATTTVLWDGSEECPSSESSLSGATALDRDVDDASAALCEAEQYFSERGAEFGLPNFRSWLDPLNEGLVFAVGAAPGLSIGARDGTSGIIVFAEGAGRAEVLGHELGHALVARFLTPGGVNASPLPDFSDYNSREGPDLEEHLADVLGMILERRLTNRGENPCLLADDEDTQNTIDIAEFDCRPCSRDHDSAPPVWRSFCNPREDNQGWCVGAEHYLEYGYNLYDIYGDATGSASCGSFEHYIASHTNVGIGNRAISMLMQDRGRTTTFRGWRVQALGQETMERLFLAMRLNLGTNTDWTSYAQAWIQATQDLFGTSGLSDEEIAVRTAFASVGIWNPEQTLMSENESGDRSLINGGTPLFRPATVSIQLSSGVERSYIFQRESATSNRVVYYWRNEPRGGRFAQLSDNYTGPCTFPFPVETAGSPSANGTSKGIYLAWSEPVDGDLGQLKAAWLPTDKVSSEGCGDEWQELVLDQERIMLGSPATALWSQLDTDLDCEVLERVLGPAAFPFRTIGAMGLTIGDCVEIGERIPDEVLRFPGGDIWGNGLIEDLLALEEFRGIPVPFDPLGPVRLSDPEDYTYSADILPVLQEQPNLQGQLAQAGANVGELFSQAFQQFSEPEGFNISFGLSNDDPFEQQGGSNQKAMILPPGGSSITARFEINKLVFAFRDEEGILRITSLGDDRATEELPVMDADPSPIDPILVPVEVTRSSRSATGGTYRTSFLYLIYGTKEVVSGVEIPTRLSYRVATSFEGEEPLVNSDFSPPMRLDNFTDTRGIRRQSDFGYLRTLNTPIVAASRERLHIFVAELDNNLSFPVPTLANRETTNTDHIRYTEFIVRNLRTGELNPVGERPVRLTNSKTNLSGTEAGAAYVTRYRRQLRYYLPKSGSMTVRTLHVY